MGETMIERYAKRLMAKDPERYPTMEVANEMAAKILEARAAYEKSKPAVMILVFTAFTIGLIQAFKDRVEREGASP